MSTAMTSDEYLDALLSLPRLLQPHVSPDGKWVAWTWYRTAPTSDVYVAPTDGSAPPVRLTDTPNNTSLASWTRDSRAVLVEEDRDGDERSRLFRVALDRPCHMTLLTDDLPNYFLRGGQLHPNGRWLMYGANFDIATGQEIEPTWIYRHDLQTGERRVLARPLKGGWMTPDLSPDGAYVLYNRLDLDPAGSQIWLVDVDGRDDHEILNFGADIKVWASWFPDGRRVLVLAETPSHSHTRLGIWERDHPTVRWLIDDPRRNIESAFVPDVADTTGADVPIVVVELRGARVYASFLDAATAAERPLPTSAGDLIPLAPVTAGVWAGSYASSRQPTDVVRFSPGQPDATRFVSLTRVWERTRLTSADFTPAEDYHWHSVDGIDIQGWLYRTVLQNALGTVVHVHGGPTARSSDAINSEIQFLVRVGFNVLDPNYRGSTGFSLAFRDAIKVQGWGGIEQEDIRSGILALLADGIAQLGKVGMTGTSYGGYSSWCGITRFPRDVLAAAVPICGMADLVVDYETTRPDLRPYSEEMLGGSPQQIPERYRERSPIHFVANIKGRLLIVQGDRDPNVTPENVRAVRAALDRAGVPYELLTFPDEGHGIKRPANEQALYLRLAQFFAEALR